MSSVEKREAAQPRSYGLAISVPLFRFASTVRFDGHADPVADSHTPFRYSSAQRVPNIAHLSDEVDSITERDDSIHLLSIMIQNLRKY